MKVLIALTVFFIVGRFAVAATPDGWEGLVAALYVLGVGALAVYFEDYIELN